MPVIFNFRTFSNGETELLKYADDGILYNATFFISLIMVFTKPLEPRYLILKFSKSSLVATCSASTSRLYWAIFACNDSMRQR